MCFLFMITSPCEQSSPNFPATQPSVQIIVSDNFLHFVLKQFGEHGRHPIPYVSPAQTAK